MSERHLRAVPDPDPGPAYSVGDRVVVFPSIPGTVESVDGERLKVLADGGVVHDVATAAVLPEL